MRKFVMVLCLGLLSCSVVADDDADQGIISYRQNVMKSAAGHLAAVKYLFKDNLALKGHLQKHANALADFATLLPDMFPEGSDFGDTDAKMAVWEKPDVFQEKVENFGKVTRAFAANPTEAAFADVGKACKACHKEFREE